MSKGKRLRRLGWLGSLAVCLSLLAAPVFGAGKAFDGKWRLTITIPVAPNSSETRSFTVEVEAAPRGESLHGRMTITDAETRTVGGVWRQVGKRVSIAYELPCTTTTPCASLVMLGKIKGENTRIKGGNVVVMWDTPNPNNHAQYDTSVGNFTATRVE
ncbi:MAG: hypothetical protein HY231_15965 [Acidobacteria bacterium]|nr:hypothetical protein [Acidobacteriota bacterium]